MQEGWNKVGEEVVLERRNGGSIATGEGQVEEMNTRSEERPTHLPQGLGKHAEKG